MLGAVVINKNSKKAIALFVVVIFPSEFVPIVPRINVATNVK